MNLKNIIIIVLAGIMSFGAVFGGSWFFFSNKAAQVAIQKELDEQNKTKTEESNSEENTIKMVASKSNSDVLLSKTMTEKQMQNHIADLRDKMRDLRTKERDLGKHEERIKIAEDSLKEEIAKLTELNIELNDTLMALKKERQLLNESVVKISNIEKKNLEMLAAVYDKMESGKAASIFLNMMGGEQTDDAVKIMSYMSERTASKVMNEVADQQPKYAALLTEKLKRIEEVQE